LRWKFNDCPEFLIELEKDRYTKGIHSLHSSIFSCYVRLTNDKIKQVLHQLVPNKLYNLNGEQVFVPTEVRRYIEYCGSRCTICNNYTPYTSLFTINIKDESHVHMTHSSHVIQQSYTTHHPSHIKGDKVPICMQCIKSFSSNIQIYLFENKSIIPCSGNDVSGIITYSESLNQTDDLTIETCNKLYKSTKDSELIIRTKHRSRSKNQNHSDRCYSNQPLRPHM
jgi:hypothetical protein